MSGIRAIQVVGPSAWLADRKTAVQRSVNCYPMATEDPAGDTPLVLESAPGLALVHDFSATIRGMRAVGDLIYVVAGAYLYQVTAAGDVQSLGAVPPGDRVEMAHGTGQLAIVDGANLSVYAFGGAVSAVTSAAWLGSYCVGFLDGYFIFADPDTEQFYLSSIDDATDLDALDFSSADRQPDSIVSLIVLRNELYLMGQTSTEVWINNGGSDFPLSRYQGTPIDVGIVGKYARCNANDALVWVGQTAQGGPYVYMLQGYQPVRISTQAVEQQLQQSTDISGATMWAYQDAGGEFVVLDAPGLETTWVWDASTKMWHERGELLAGEWIASRIEHHAYRGGVHYVGGGTKLYTLSRDVHDLAGDALVRERTWPHLVGGDLESRQYHALELRCTTGGEPEGAITLEISNDGGSVWTSPLRRTLGATGRRTQRVRWMPLGTCQAGGSRVFRLRCDSAVKLTIQGATVT